MRKVICFSFFLISIINSYSQNDSIDIAERIASFESSKSDLISKGRRLLIQEFEHGNIQSVADIKNYLLHKVEDEDHLALWIPERWLIDFWTGSYSDMLDYALLMNLDSLSNTHKFAYIPPDDLVGLKFSRGVIDEYDSIVEDFNSMDFSADTKAYLNLFLNRLLMVYDKDFISMNEINDLSDEFLIKYPHSPLAKIVRENISYKLELGDFGWALSFGGGLIFDTGNLNEHIKQTAGVDVGFDLYYKKYYFGLNLLGLFGKARKDIQLKHKDRIWPENEDLNVVMVAPVMGYNVLDHGRFRLIPFAGLLINSASPSEDEKKDNPDLKGLNLGVSVSPVVGFGLDFSFTNTKRINPMSPSAGIVNSIGLKAYYTPNPLNKQGRILDGDLFFIGLSYKMGLFRLKRVY